MQDILKEYGPAIITAAAVIALVVLVQTLIGSDENSVVWGAFSKLLNYFFEQVMPATDGSESGAIYSITNLIPA